MNLKDKIALVTGASRGIGRAVSELLIECGATVIGTATSKEGVVAISENFGKNGKGFILDVSQSESIESTLKNVKSEFGDIDILVNNAGITRDILLMRMKDKEWKDVIDTNLTSIFRLSKLVLPGMIKKRNGRIINIGSVIGSIGNIGQANYAATKAGVVGLTKSMAREVASRGITVNTVSPGFIETNMSDVLNDKQREAILVNVPIGRLGNPRDIGFAVAFLASSESAYITGETLHVNGGMYMV
ncbi:3-oxoacyl reductase [Candidatus Photodesmus blepharus]|uniref:3-oxoacyl-[acyl-carrier-protein] reductase n=1 Tax=Candidatus Photodesmus blepharonis TaxID=1179155 RepID=A0A084CN24_9GAMM|nr:3-oxoacyl-ACP reductase FabG [Candidatus Photodesmus blepharus]KEY91203.1 3-oxoacyl reductase [Candidatus Photodesmus blepharus]